MERCVKPTMLVTLYILFFQVFKPFELEDLHAPTQEETWAFTKKRVREKRREHITYTL